MDGSNCTCGKVRYFSRKQARQAARRIPVATRRLHVYQCDGGFWHLTSQDAAHRASGSQRKADRMWPGIPGTGDGG